MMLEIEQRLKFQWSSIITFSRILPHAPLSTPLSPLFTSFIIYITSNIISSHPSPLSVARAMSRRSSNSSREEEPLLSKAASAVSVSFQNTKSIGAAPSLASFGPQLSSIGNSKNPITKPDVRIFIYIKSYNLLFSWNHSYVCKYVCDGCNSNNRQRLLLLRVATVTVKRTNRKHCFQEFVCLPSIYQCLNESTRPVSLVRRSTIRRWWRCNVV